MQITQRPLVQSTTLLQGLGASAFTAIGVQNGIRTQQLPQVSKNKAHTKNLMPGKKTHETCLLRLRELKTYSICGLIFAKKTDITDFELLDNC